MPKTNRGRKPRTDKTKTSEPIKTVPKPPADLGKYGKEYWNKIAPQLIELGILTELHLETFRTICDLWDEYRRLYLWIAEDPTRLTISTDTGYRQTSPEVQQRDKALAGMQRMWMKFGLTPYALAQLGKHGGMKKQLPKIKEFAKRKYS